jgi:peptidyl-prolyl cis-trans isomerase B (cyclophilin B)
MSTPYTPSDEGVTQAIPAYRPGPSADFTQRAQNGFTAEERAARSGRPVLSGAEQVSDDRSTWPHALTDGFAVGSLILSILGFGVIGIILGAIHVSNVHKLRQRASAVAAWGIGLGIAGTVAWVLLIIMLIVAAASVGSAPAYGG